MTTMTKRLALGMLVGALGLGGGCGSEASPIDPRCGEDGFICDTSGLPFAKTIIAVTDYCAGLVADCALPTPPPAGATTANLSKPAPGKLCVSGFLSQGGMVWLIVGFSEASADGMSIVKSFDANALGITQADFTIDSPLKGGVAVAASTTPPAPVDCPQISCFTNYDLATPEIAGVAAHFTAPGPQIAPFANFYQADGGSNPLDAVALEHLAFAPSTPGDYDFCISDIKFRNAAGDEVRP
jgi:hypothetical protein